MGRWKWPAAWLAVAAAAAVAVLFGRAVIHFLGIDTQQSDNYDFWSGVGPCLISAAGLSTLIVSAWHAVNCHEPGCPRIGKHKVEGTPWCNRHHGRAREQASATLDDLAAKLDVIIAQLGGRRRK